MSPGIDFKEMNPPAYVAWRRAGTQPYSYSFLSPIDCLKIRALNIKFLDEDPVLGDKRRVILRSYPQICDFFDKYVFQVE
jgi:hypothetical protein